MKIEYFDSKKHDSIKVANLIYETDIEFNELIFGKKVQAIAFISKLLTIKAGFYTKPYLQCIIKDNEIIGIVSGYNLGYRAKIDRAVGSAFIRAFGFFGFLRRLGVLLKLNRALSGKMSKSGYYIVYLCVGSEYRGLGTGKNVIEYLSKSYPLLYLHVSVINFSAIRFYEANGFKKIYESKVLIRKQVHATFTMQKETITV